MFYPCKGRKWFRAQIHYPVKASGDQKMRNCFTLPYISGSFLPIALIKKVSILKIYKAVVGCGLLIWKGRVNIRWRYWKGRD
jgi:hypothetical protein